MSRLDRYKLDTSFGDGSVTHTTTRTDLAARQRKVAVQTTWNEKRTLGSGGFGIVTLQQTDGGDLRAVKKIFKGLGTFDFSRELVVLSKVAHVWTPGPNTGNGISANNLQRQDLFVQFLGWYENADCVFIAMEYIAYGDLSHYIKKPGPRSTSNIREITRQLLEGLATLHEMNISHRDLKPQV